VRDQAVGILATGPNAVHQALLFRQLSENVVFFRHTGPGLAPEQAEQLAAMGVRMVDGEVTGIEVTDDRLTGVRLLTGEVVPRSVLVVAPRFTARAGVLESLGAPAVDQEMGGHVVGSAVPADPTGATSVPGVWVAGNVSDLSAQVVVSAAAGMRAGAMINADLVAEDARVAVAAHRSVAA
jgi:thioredoxin reductase